MVRMPQISKFLDCRPMPDRIREEFSLREKKQDLQEIRVAADGSDHLFPGCNHGAEGARLEHYLLLDLNLQCT